MRFRRGRFVQPEILDDQAPERAAPSLRDIVRINRLTGGHKILRDTFRRLVGSGERFTVLDIGAASGDAAAEILALHPNASVVSLDYRHHHLSVAPAPRLVADAFRLPISPRSVDFVYCGLFLHHFSNEAVINLLRSFALVARRSVIVNDLERHVLPYWFLPATRWVFGWDPITLHDGPISVQAGFTGPELRTLAQRAGLSDIEVRVHRPAFRVSLVARGADGKLTV